MNLYAKSKSLKIGLWFSLVTLTACATTTPAPVVSEPKKETANVEDTSSPSLPVAAAVTQPAVQEKDQKAKSAPAAPKHGTVESVLSKMESSPYTLYWKEKDSYSYYVGGLIDAEFKPGSGLTVRTDDTSESRINCEFDSHGKINPANSSAAEACSKLILTLDDELSD